MNFIYKSKLLSAAVIISAMMFATKGHADGHTPKIKAELVLKGLENPWDTAFLNDGTMFFTEKCKGLSVKTKSGVNALYGMKGSKGYSSAGKDLFCEKETFKRKIQN